MKKLLIYPFLLIAIALSANEYDYEASIDNIEGSGFYKIMLPTDVTAKLKSDFSDIRIYDSANIETPYIFKQENRVNSKELFTEYKIITKKHLRSKGYTRILIHNSEKNKINNIVLEIKNADVRKVLKLNASNDKKNWYILKDNYYYNSIYNTESTSELRVLNFPLSDYEYYELLIDDFFDKPINVIKAGCYDLIRESGKYTQLKGICFTSQDTLKQTTISIPVNRNYVDKIDFNISAPKFYKRTASIFINDYTTIGQKVKVTKRLVANFKLISNSGNSVNLRNIQADTIYVVINNNDNHTLEIDDIKLYQLNKYLISELDSGNKYNLAFSDKEASKPSYDLKFFSNEIPENAKTIKVGNIKAIYAKEESSNNIDFSNYWLWISIIVIALLLAFMSYKMVKEKKED